MAKPNMNSCNSEGGAGPSSLHPPLHHHHPHPHHHHHHHHIFYVSPNCPLHRPISQPNNHSPSCSFSSYHLSAQCPPTFSTTLPDPNLSFSDLTDGTFHDGLMVQDEIKDRKVEEEEEEPMFVLTDEWREFFAKSEAKRRLAKKQIMKKGKN